MNKPKMIIFDYGHTLCYESDFDGVRGTAAILKHAVRNKNSLTAEEVSSNVEPLAGRGKANRRGGKNKRRRIRVKRLGFFVVEIFINLCYSIERIRVNWAVISIERQNINCWI